MARHIVGSVLTDMEILGINNNFEFTYTAAERMNAFLGGTGTVGRAMIADGSVDGSKLADGAVTFNKISNSAILPRHLTSFSVSASKIADDSIGSRHVLNGTLGREQLTNKFLFTRRIENEESIDTVFDDGLYIITSGNSGTFPEGEDINLNWALRVEVINEVWVEQTLFVLAYQNISYKRTILATSGQLYPWHKELFDGNNVIKQNNIQDKSVSRSKLTDNFLYSGRIENDTPIENVVQDGTYIITSGNTGDFPEGESAENHWALSVEVVNVNYVYQTLIRLIDPDIRYTRVINALDDIVYPWKKFDFGNSKENDVPGTINSKNILLIGNSFSLNATEYIHNICASMGIDINVGILYRSGESLEAHYNNSQTNESIYTYYERVSNGGTPNNTTTTNVSFSEGLQKRNWDVVTFQQRSGYSNDYATYQPYLDDLIAIINNAIGDEVEFGILQTWAYSSTQNVNPEQMYNDIVDAYDQAMFDSDIGLIIPAGTAVQNARSNTKIKSVDDELTSDGVHLGDLGKYIASVTVFESLYRGQSSAKQIDYKPAIVTKYQKYISELSAMNAVDTPKRVENS